MLEVHVLWDVLDLEDEYKRRCAISSGSLKKLSENPKQRQNELCFCFERDEMEFGQKAIHAVKLSCTSNSGGLTFVKSIGIWHIK